MKNFFLFVVTICQVGMVFSQRREALIAPVNPIKQIFEPANRKDNIVRGIIRVKFLGESQLQVSSTKLIYLAVLDSTTNVKSLEYRGGTWVIYDRLRADWYRTRMDSLFRSFKYEIINKDYQVFVTKGDFAFSLQLQKKE